MMWTVAAINKKYSDALGTYNSLCDPHLHQYFRKPKVRTHLIQAGLMTSEGKVIPEALIRLRKLEDERRQQLHQLLNEVLEKGEENSQGLKRLHQTRTLESETKRELVERAKIAFNKSNSTSSGLTTRTPSHISSNGLTQKTTSSANSMNWLRRVVQIRPKVLTNKRRKVKVKALNRYQRPKSSYGIRSSNKIKPDLEEELNEQFSDILSLDGESIRDTDSEDNGQKRSLLWAKKSLTYITLRFNGLTPNCLIHRRVQISQQLNSGGNAIIIFDRMVAPAENLTFCVRPHGSKPFCITVLIDGIRDLRVSTCCEHKHKKGSKISHFTLVDVRGGKMCSNCKKLNTNPKAIGADSGVGIRGENFEIKEMKNNEIINESEINVNDNDINDCEHNAIELDKKSTTSSSPVNYDNNEEQFENYESEFETETPESLYVRSTSVSSDDTSVVVRQEVVAVEVHNNPLD